MLEKKDAGEGNHSPPEPLHVSASTEAEVTGTDARGNETTTQGAEAAASKDPVTEEDTPNAVDALQRLESASQLVRLQASEGLQAHRTAANAKMGGLPGRSEPRETLAGSRTTEPGAYRVTVGHPGSSGELTDEEGDPIPPPATPTPPQDQQERQQQQGTLLDLTHPSIMPVAPSADLAPLILEAMVVLDSPDHNSSTRNAANKALLVEGRPESPNRRRIWLILLGLLTLGVAVGISVGITQSRSAQGSAAQSTNGTSPTAPPTFAPTSLAVVQEFFESLPEPTQSLIKSDTTSPQSKAFTWISSRSHPRYEVDAMKRFKQRFALATLYYATSGDAWRKNDGWLNESVNECEWFVSTCSSSREACLLIICHSSPRSLLVHRARFGCSCTTLNDTVQSLKIDSNNLRGEIPSEIGFLTGLDQLGLYTNHLRGTLPTEIGLLTRMLHLFMSDNKNLTGLLPSELARLTDLNTIVLSNCSFTGTIPTEFGGLSGLIYLVLSNSSLTSTIPTELAKLSLLDSLFLDGNELVETIPSELGRLPALYSANLGHNKLTGSIPSEIAALPTIFELNLQNNSLIGRYVRVRASLQEDNVPFFRDKAIRAISLALGLAAQDPCGLGSD
jgi:Leucine rich repeat